MIFRSAIVLSFLLLGCFQQYEPLPESPRAAEVEDTINAYRATLGLEAIPMSPSLRHVARRHLADLEALDPQEPCNLHSWSSAGPWSSCCYRSEADSACMTEKPLELSDYKGQAFEIAVSSFGPTPLSPERAFELWKASPAHDEVMANRGPWNAKTWRAMGAAIGRNYAVVWFGEADDPVSDIDTEQVLGW